MILLTGATGFIGKAVAQKLMQEGHVIVATTRRDPVHEKSIPYLQSSAIIWKHVGKINKSTPWLSTLNGVKIVVHCAARVHVSNEKAMNPLEAYREVNVGGTLHLARTAAAAGVQRFVFLSSVGVNGNRSNRPFTEADEPNPSDAYSISKLEAERGLFLIAQDTEMEIVVIRPPLVYGPNAPGNFHKLVKLVTWRVPLPLNGLHNLRSFVAVDNLVNMIILCADRSQSPNAANQVFFVADDRYLSTTELLIKVGQAAKCRSRLFPVPARLLLAIAVLIGNPGLANRLLDDLQVDTSKARLILGWKPVVSIEEQLAAMFDQDATSESKLNKKSIVLLRALDVVLSSLAILLLWPLIVILYIIVFFETGVPLLRQERVGRNMQPFLLVKFRTMRIDTPHVASHLANPAAITPLGSVLRRTKLDELPQLWNVLLGDMSLVGARPCLLNQNELIHARAILDVYLARPGITGLAQVTGIDMSNPELLAQTDAQMLKELTIFSYFKYIWMTILGKGVGDRVKN